MQLPPPKKHLKQFDEKKMEKYVNSISSYLKLSKTLNFKDLSRILLEKDRELKIANLYPLVKKKN